MPASVKQGRTRLTHLRIELYRFRFTRCQPAKCQCCQTTVTVVVYMRRGICTLVQCIWLKSIGLRGLIFLEYWTNIGDSLTFFFEISFWLEIFIPNARLIYFSKLSLRTMSVINMITMFKYKAHDNNISPQLQFKIIMLRLQIE